MRILFIGDNVYEGGAVRSLVDLTGELQKRGHQCVVCTSGQGRYNEVLQDRGIESIQCGHVAVMEPYSPYKWKQPIKDIYRRIARWYASPRAIHIIESSKDIKQFDIIHSNTARTDLGCLLSQRYGIPHIMHIREFGDDDFNCRIYRRNYIDYLNTHTDVFIAISKAVASHWIAKGIRADKVITVYNGVDPTKISRSETEKTENRLRMVIVGGVCEAKGQLLAVKAVHKVVDDGIKDIHLDVVGWEDPRYVAEINGYVEQHHLKDYISLRGKDDDIQPHLDSYNVGLMCSKSEGFGRVTVEYMFAGLAVIASNSGANPELVENGSNGLLFETGRSDDLARCMEELYYNQEQMKTIRNRACAYANEKFTIANNASNIEKVYSLVTDESRAGN